MGSMLFLMESLNDKGGFKKNKNYRDFFKKLAQMTRAKHYLTKKKNHNATSTDPPQSTT